MMTRCFSPPLRVAKGRASKPAVPVAASAAAPARNPGALDLERAEMRVAAHQDHFEDGVVERQVRFLGHDRHAPRQHRARDAPQVLPVERDAAGRGLRVPASTFSSVVLPDPFGPRIPTQRHLSGDLDETPRSTSADS